MTSMPTWASLRRTVTARRRGVGALLVALAVLCAVSAARPGAPRSVLVLAAARDLAPGAALTLADVAPVGLPPGAVPAGALRPGAAVLGRLVAGAVRRGEPLTDVRLLGPALLASFAAGLVAVPVRFADATAAALLRPGDRIDVLAAPTSEPATPLPDATSAPLPDATSSPPSRASPAPVPAARVVAAGVVVVLVATGDASALGNGALGDGAFAVVACAPDVARALAAAAATDRLSPALLSDGRPP